MVRRVTLFNTVIKGMTNKLRDISNIFQIAHLGTIQITQ
jgi:hypothetical protein